ncbi:MAG TPA: M48 family metalloprotease [Streptosporangiaceae bacterium]|nr:M48 family metalloprotease [Streptosporangiaceae bacterium]
MDVFVWLPLVISAIAALAARPLADRLPPRTATWLLAASAVVLAGASCGVLGLLALAAAMRIPFVDAAAGMSIRAVNSRDPASVPLGILAGALLAAAAIAAVRAAWLRTTALVAAHQHSRRLPMASQLTGAAEAVVVQDDGVDAYTVPGWPSRIVVTSGMLAALAPDERAVLLAHERAHAGSCHYLFTAVARLAAAANPLLSPLATAIGYSVERWADERAAAAAGSRPLVARAIAKAALAATVAPALRAQSAVLLGALPRPSTARGPGLVPRRVAALLGPPPKLRIVPLVLAVALVAIAGLSAFDAARDLHAMIELAQSAA